uniref:BAR domain-containing protein n=1 Tax=Parascaris univalens TaxID=6257 RepID=A0A915A0C1_PARUN
MWLTATSRLQMMLHNDSSRCSSPMKQTDGPNVVNDPAVGTEAVTPMEISTQCVQPENQNAFKKLFMKLGEKVGTVKTSELSAEYLNAVKDADAYKEMLCHLAASMMQVLQPNPELVPATESTMQLESEQGKDPYELLLKTLDEVKQHFCAHTASLETSIETCRRLAATHREYQRKGRRAMHFMRTFINVDFTELNEERHQLLARRQEMDFARHEYTNKASEPKKRTYEAALSKFTQQSEKVLEMLRLLSKKKEIHRLELIKFLDEMRMYHDKAFEACSKASKATW